MQLVTSDFQILEWKRIDPSCCVSVTRKCDTHNGLVKSIFSMSFNADRGGEINLHVSVCGGIGARLATAVLGLTLGGVSNLWNGLWNGLMEWTDGMY